MGYILAIDQGTTSSRAIVFDAEMRPIAMAQQEFPQIFPASGWVEHAPDAIWNSVLATCQMAIKQAGIDAGQLAGIGLTNQRETTLIWDKKTGAPIGNAIVWQDRRTAARCTQLKEQGHEALIAEKTGLLLIFQPPRRLGYWITRPARGRVHRRASWPLAPLTAG